MLDRLNFVCHNSYIKRQNKRNIMKKILIALLLLSTPALSQVNEMDQDAFYNCVEDATNKQEFETCLDTWEVYELDDSELETFNITFS